MTIQDLTQQELDKLLDNIIEHLMANGIKATTMDSIAAGLHISKRTLYEIFGSKNEMLMLAFERMHRVGEENAEAIFASTDNIIEALMLNFKLLREMVKKSSPEFLRDFEDCFRGNKEEAEKHRSAHFRKNVALLERGAAEGYFRPDLDYGVATRMLWIQMESIRRMEEIFPPGITLLQVIDHILVSFMRSCVTPAHMDAFEQTYARLLENDKG